MEKFIGPGLKNNTQEDLNEFSEFRKERGLKKIPGELKKTYEEEKLLKSLSDSLNNEIRSLGLPIINFPVERIHLLPDHFYYVSESESHATGNFLINKNSLEVEVSRENKLNNFQQLKDKLHKLIHLSPVSYLANKEKDAEVILHELVHSKSLSGFFINSSNLFLSYKGGYTTRGQEKGETAFGQVYFAGLNEAVTQKITKELLFKNKIFEQTNEENIKKPSVENSPYEGYISVLDMIIKTLAQFEHKNEDEIWSRFKKNYFTGQMMHLRKIEEVFGVGSLRVLASMNPSTMSQFELEEGSKYMKYFTSGISEEERAKIEMEILSWEEKRKKEKHVEISQNINNK